MCKNRSSSHFTIYPDTATRIPDTAASPSLVNGAELQYQYLTQMVFGFWLPTDHTLMVLTKRAVKI